MNYLYYLQFGQNVIKPTFSFMLRSMKDMAAFMPSEADEYLYVYRGQDVTFYRLPAQQLLLKNKHLVDIKEMGKPYKFIDPNFNPKLVSKIEDRAERYKYVIDHIRLVEQIGFPVALFLMLENPECIRLTECTAYYRDSNNKIKTAKVHVFITPSTRHVIVFKVEGDLFYQPFSYWTSFIFTRLRYDLLTNKFVLFLGVTPDKVGPIIKTNSINLEIKMNIARYIELVQKDEKLNLYFTSPVEYQELLSYQGELTAQVYYANKNDYLKLLKSYLDQQILLDGFIDEFFNLYESDMQKYEAMEKDFKKVETIEFNLEASDFFSFVEAIWSLFELVNDVHYLSDDENANRLFIRNALTDIYQTSKFFNK